MFSRIWVVVVGAFLLATAAPFAEPVAVRHPEGLTHGFLTLRAADGKRLATGDLIQGVRGDRVNSRLVFRFTDGSVSDETTVYSQRGHFSLISDHLVQSGPAFEQAIETTIDRASGRVRVRYRDDGAEKVEDERMDLPPDLANGMLIPLLKNVRREALPPSVSLVAATPKPRLVKLVFTAAGREPFTVAGSRRTATHYVVKVDIGGLAGLVAPLIGKQPPDSDVWILEGAAPAFIRSRAPMAAGGPLWITELAAPTWPRR